MASSAPATSAHPIADSASGLSCCGLVRGISFIVRHSTMQMSPMNTSGAQKPMFASIFAHEYHGTSFATAVVGG